MVEPRIFVRKHKGYWLWDCLSCYSVGWAATFDIAGREAHAHAEWVHQTMVEQARSAVAATRARNAAADQLTKANAALKAER